VWRWPVGFIDRPIGPIGPISPIQSQRLCFETSNANVSWWRCQIDPQRQTPNAKRRTPNAKRQSTLHARRLTIASGVDGLATAALRSI
jgi:hypothetical protein